MRYVGRYNNGSNYMEWAATPVATIAEAKKQVKNIGWTDVDVCQVLKTSNETRDGLPVEGEVVATGVLGQGWSDEEN